MVILLSINALTNGIRSVILLRISGRAFMFKAEPKAWWWWIIVMSGLNLFFFLLLLSSFFFVSCLLFDYLFFHLLIWLPFFRSKLRMCVETLFYWMSSTAVIAFRNILISEFIMIVVAFAPCIVPGFGFMKIDYVLLINVSSMFLNLIN